MPLEIVGQQLIRWDLQLRLSTLNSTNSAHVSAKINRHPFFSQYSCTSSSSSRQGTQSLRGGDAILVTCQVYIKVSLHLSWSTLGIDAGRFCCCARTSANLYVTRLYCPCSRGVSMTRGTRTTSLNDVK